MCKPLTLHKALKNTHTNHILKVYQLITLFIQYFNSQSISFITLFHCLALIMKSPKQMCLQKWHGINFGPCQMMSLKFFIFLKPIVEIKSSEENCFLCSCGSTNSWITNICLTRVFLRFFFQKVCFCIRKGTLRTMQFF